MKLQPGEGVGYQGSLREEKPLDHQRPVLFVREGQVEQEEEKVEEQFLSCKKEQTHHANLSSDAPCRDGVASHRDRAVFPPSIFTRLSNQDNS